MILKVQFFAAAKELLGKSELDCQIELDRPANISDLKDFLTTHHPELTDILKTSTFSVDRQYATPQTVLNPDQEIACIPPVSGG